MKGNQLRAMKAKIYLSKNFCNDTAFFFEYIIQHVLHRIFSFMFNLCQMSYQEESLTSLMGLQLKKRQSVIEKIVPKREHFEILMPWRSKRKIHNSHITFLMWTCVYVGLSGLCVFGWETRQASNSLSVNGGLAARNKNWQKHGERSHFVLPDWCLWKGDVKAASILPLQRPLKTLTPTRFAI